MFSPLLCFLSQTLEESVTTILGFTQKFPPEPIVVEQTTIRKWKLANQFFYSCVVTVPGAKRGALKHVKNMAATFRGNILFFDNSVTNTQLTSAGVGSMRNLIIVKTVENISSGLNILVDSEQAYLLHQKLFAPEARGGRRRFQPVEEDESTRDQISFADRFVEGMMEGRHIEAPSRLVYDGLIFNNPSVFVAPDAMFVVQDARDEGDEAFALAQTLSMEHEQPPSAPAPVGGGRRRRSRYSLPPPGGGQRRRPRSPSPPRLQDSWKRVLKVKSDPIESPSDPVCIVCRSHKATICFVECMHTVLCDECVSHMWTMPNRRGECPVCRVVPSAIVRPISAATSEGK